MAFLEHIDPGNSGGSVLIPETNFDWEIEPVVFPCKLCNEIFKDQAALSDHRIEEHPLKRPTLIINGQPVRKVHIIVRSTISVESISFNDVDSIYVNDEKVTNQQELIKWLCSTSPATFDLKLLNQNYSVSYRWTIDIARIEELDKVDGLFYSAFRSGLGVCQAFSFFNEQVAGLSSATKNYAAGLSCYVTAIITKDQLSGSTLEFNKYSQKLGEAMDILYDYRGRLLADAIFSIAEFMQNNFQLSSTDRSLPGLYVTKQFFNSGKFLGALTSNNESQTIPIDMTTDSIVDFVSGPSEYQLDNISAIEGLKRSDRTDVLDRAKLVFVLWTYYMMVGDKEKAGGLRGSLIHNKYFSSLAEAIENSLDE